MRADSAKDGRDLVVAELGDRQPAQQRETSPRREFPFDRGQARAKGGQGETLPGDVVEIDAPRVLAGPPHLVDLRAVELPDPVASAGLFGTRPNPRRV